MNKVIEITIRNKVARIASSPIIVGKNKDYIVRFDFDEDWDKYDTKTARFSQDGEYQDIIFAGNECSMPALDGGKVVEVGVYAGNISTTAPASLKVHKSIIDDDGVPADPTPDVYAQLMERFNAMEAPAAVLYTAQELTDEQKAIARENISAMAAIKKVSTGTNIILEDNTEYRLEDVTSLTISYPDTEFECWVRLKFADAGDIAVTMPESKYIGSAPTFANGETWELSIKDGVVIAQKVGNGT